MNIQKLRAGALVLALSAVAWASQAAEVAGVKVDEQIRVGSTDLLLNGAGLRSKLFIKVYVGALYVSQKASTPAAIVDSTAPRRMAMRMMRDVDADTLYGALEEGLKANHSAAEWAELKVPVDQLAALMKGIGQVREGDTVALDMTAEGVVVTLNGNPRGKVVAQGLSKALLKIWLGDKPVDASLKKALLGG